MFEDIKDVQILADKLNILESKVQLYEKELANLRASKYSCRNIVGESTVMQELRKMGQRAAKVNSPVLLVGESGTGKELFAHAIHRASDRHKLPFIRLNCAAIPKDLLEAELFGYEPGAFTGAGNKGKPGKFELAHQGTIFLDEISELPLEMQPKLLRVLEEKLVDRLGGHKARQVRLPSHRGDKRKPRGLHPEREVPQGPLLPPQRHPPAHPAASGAQGGHLPHRLSPHPESLQGFRSVRPGRSRPK